MENVPPNVANAAAQGKLNRAGDVRRSPYLRVTRAAKRLKIANHLHTSGLITGEELGEHHGFYVRCTASAAGVVAAGGAPDWFRPALAAGIAPMLERLGNLEAMLRDLGARQANALARSSADQLLPIRNEAGIVAPNFPATLLALMSMNEGQLVAFLQHYGQPVGGDAEAKRQRVRKVLGMPIA